jgi:hypothetical protein
MLIAAFAAAALLTTSPQTAPQAAAPDPVTEAPIVLEDVTVTGRSLDTLIEDFVSEVAEPNRNRGLARWRGTVCVSVANLKGEAAQYLVDRISTVAEDLGLRPGAPGCRPNLLIIATEDSSTLAHTLVAEHRDKFRMGASGTDRGMAALRDFQETDRPVRWWQQTMLVDSQTGMRAVRLPGECRAPCASVFDEVPVIPVFAASRLSTQLINDILRMVVIIDVDEVSDLSILQLADYVAMVSLAQIDPDADTARYASILNVLDDPTVADGLTNWDLTYLQGLYGAERNRVNIASERSLIEQSIRREHTRLRAELEPVAAD